MNEFLIYPLSAKVISEIKEKMLDAFGNRPKLEEAQSRRSICRRCLRRFNPGERRLLFKYKPFERESVFAEAGPIYVHESECKPATKILTAYPEEFRELPLLLTADETAALLRTTRKAIYVMASRRQLPGVTHVGRRVLVRRDDLLHWLDQIVARHR